MNYLELKDDIQVFIDGNLGSLRLGATGLLNKACRYIRDRYKWNHLLIVDESVSVDSTGKLIALGGLAHTFHELKHLALLTQYRGTLKRDTDFTIKVTPSADLSASATLYVNLWTRHSAGLTMYLTYYRDIKQFTNGTTEQYPDIPNSGDAILDTAKYLGLKMTMDKSTPSLIQFYENEAHYRIRDLKFTDAGRIPETEAPYYDLNTTIHVVNNYNPQNGEVGMDGNMIAPASWKGND